MKRKEIYPEISCSIEPKKEGKGTISVEQIADFNYGSFNITDPRMAMGLIYADDEINEIKKEVLETPLP